MMEKMYGQRKLLTNCYSHFQIAANKKIANFQKFNSVPTHKTNATEIKKQTNQCNDVRGGRSNWQLSKKQNIPKEIQISIIFQLLLIVLWYNMGDGYTLKSSLYFVMKLKF